MMVRFLLILLLVPLALVQQASAQAPKLNVLIVDGQNNHGDWPKITAMMKTCLEDTGRFEVDVARTRYLWNGNKWLPEYALNDGREYEQVQQPKADPDFKPDFAKYDVVISNLGHGAADWPEETQQSFVDYVKNGGGFVVVHAANNSFPKWREYNEIIGLGGWGGRNESDGPYVYYDQDNKLVTDRETKGGGGGHGPQHEFSVVIRDAKHPITKGLPESFMHAKDELYERLRGPAVGMKVLATAFAAPDKNGSGRHEPMLMTIEYGKGRVFHTPMGHADYSLECVGLITLLQRGTEWAATGEVTLPIPDDFPGPQKPSQREYKKSETP